MDYFVAQRLRRIVIVAIVLAAAFWAWRAFFFDAVDLPELPPIPGISTRDPADAAAPASGTASGAQANPPLYKWRDANGRWNITDQPPKDRPYEKVVVNPDQNVIPSIAPPAEEQKADD